MKPLRIARFAAYAAVLSCVLGSCAATDRTPPTPESGKPTASGSSATGAASTGTSVAQPEKKAPTSEELVQTAASEAFEKRDPAACAKLRSGSGACADQYWTMMSTYGMDPSACRNLSATGAVAECLTAANAYVESYATTLSDCRKIRNSESRLRCSDRVSLENAKLVGAAGCDALRTDDLKRSCRDDVAFRSATSLTGSLAGCRRISNATMRKSCEEVRMTLPGSKEVRNDDPVPFVGSVTGSDSGNDPRAPRTGVRAGAGTASPDAPQSPASARTKRLRSLSGSGSAAGN